MKRENHEEMCTTSEAAEVLGRSPSSVKRLAERGELVARKTNNGHWRISVESLQAYKSRQQDAPAAKPSSTSNVLIVEDNKMQRLIYEKLLHSWSLPITLTFCEYGYQALLEVSSRRYDILLADVMMEGMDGYEVIQNVLASSPLSNIHIAVISSMTRESLEARGKLPDGVVFFPKPIVYDELKGYLRACCAVKMRKAAR